MLMCLYVVIIAHWQKYNRLVKTLSFINFTLGVCPVIVSSKNTLHSYNTRILLFKRVLFIYDKCINEYIKGLY